MSAPATGPQPTLRGLFHALRIPCQTINALAAIPLPRQTLFLLLVSKVSMTFALFYMGEPLKLDDPWAGLCLVGALYFIFRSP